MSWDTTELDSIGRAHELTITSYRRDGSRRRLTPIWVVRVDDDLYVRSAFGADAAWFRYASAGAAHVTAGGVDSDAVLELAADEATNDKVTAADTAKYRSQPGALAQMVADLAAGTTSRLIKRWPPRSPSRSSEPRAWPYRGVGETKDHASDGRQTTDRPRPGVSDLTPPPGKTAAAAAR